MTKFQTVWKQQSRRFITGTIIIWGLVIISIIVSLIEYFSTRHSILLLVVVALAVNCVISLTLFVLILPVFHNLDVLELWMTDSARQEIVQPIQGLPFQNKSTEFLLRACNALSVRLRVDSCRRIQLIEQLAHDMRSSLASIQGYAEVLTIDYQVGIEVANLHTYGKIIANQTNQLVEMIEDAQTVFHISEDHLSFNFEPVKPRTLISALIAETRRNTDREIIYQDDLGECMITGDSFRLHQMLKRLVGNALSSSISNISIHTQVDQDQSRSWVKIRIEDHGNALSELELASLFLHPFEPPTNCKTSPLFRSNLNIYIIKAIIDGHKGELTIQSQPEQGTTYTVLLPI